MSVGKLLRLAAVGTAVVALTATACGQGSDQGASGGLPGTINLYAMTELSGPGANVGNEIKNGLDLGVEQVNASGLLGQSKLAVQVDDDQTSANVGASLANQAATRDSPIVFGPAFSSEAVAVAPILSRKKQPTIFTQAGSDGVLVSPEMFRLTPLQEDLVELDARYLKQRGAKRVTVLIASDNPTQPVLAKKLKELGPKFGYEITDEISVLGTQSNISGEIARVVGTKPDAVVALLVTSQFSTAATLLRQGGFSGPVISTFGAAGGVLTPAGAAADGFTWATDWASPGTNETSKRFVDAYKAKYNKEPSAYAAEAYDAVWFGARGLKQAGSTDKAAVAAALAQVGKAGFDGALGDGITVVNGQQKADGTLVTWQNGSAKLVPPSEYPPVGQN